MRYKKCQKCGCENDTMFNICKKCGAVLPDTIYGENTNSDKGITRESIGNGTVRNAVSSVLQVYAIINGIAAVILAFIIGSDFYGGIGIAVAATGIVASFLIYAFGEVIQLLEDIKNNTKKK